MDPIIELPYQFDVVQLLDCMPVEFFLPAFTDKHHQLAITHSPDCEFDPWFDGIGSLYDYDKKVQVKDTGGFTILNTWFSDTYMETVVNVVKQQATTDGVKIGRIRVLMLKPKTCYTLHRDPEEFRYHIPLVTSSSSIFVVGTQVYRMPKVGTLYKLHTRDYHTAINTHISHDRTHLVFDTYRED